VGKLWDVDWIEGFLAINQWARGPDAGPRGGLPPDVDLLIQQNSLAKGEVSLNRGPVRLKDIRCPYLNVICNQDTIVPPASSEPLTALVGSDDATELRLKSGHGGLVAGR
jgi:polyhydroxyalkanoate synthase